MLSYHFGSSRSISRLTTCALLGGLVVTATGCFEDDDEWRYGRRGRSPVDVNVVFDRGVDFSQYRTFAFRSDDDEDAERLEGLEPAARRDLQLVNQRTAVELRELGLTEVSPEAADLVAFSLGRTTSRTGVTWSCVGGVWGGYYWDYYDPCAWLQPVYVDVDRTTLMVGLLDPELSEVIFAGFIRGVGEGRARRSRQIAVGVSRIFARYPGRPVLLDAGSDGDGGLTGVDASAPGSDAGSSALDAGVLDAGVLDAGGDGGTLAP